MAYFARQNFFGNQDGYSAEIPRGSKILLKLLYLARFSSYKHFYVCNFCKKLKKMAAIFGETKFVEKSPDDYSAEIACGSKISLKSFYLVRFSRYKDFCVLHFLRKIQNARHFWQNNNF